MTKASATSVLSALDVLGLPTPAGALAERCGRLPHAHSCAADLPKPAWEAAMLRLLRRRRGGLADDAAQVAGWPGLRLILSPDGATVRAAIVDGPGLRVAGVGVGDPVLDAGRPDARPGLAIDIAEGRIVRIVLGDPGILVPGIDEPDPPLVLDAAVLDRLSQVHANPGWGGVEIAGHRFTLGHLGPLEMQLGRDLDPVAYVAFAARRGGGQPNTLAVRMRHAGGLPAHQPGAILLGRGRDPAAYRPAAAETGDQVFDELVDALRDGSWPEDASGTGLAMIQTMVEEGGCDASIEYGADLGEVRSALAKLLRQCDAGIDLPRLAAHDPRDDRRTDRHLAAFDRFLAGLGWRILVACDAELRMLTIIRASDLEPARARMRASGLDWAPAGSADDGDPGAYDRLAEPEAAPPPPEDAAAMRQPEVRSPIVPWRDGAGWGLCSPDGETLHPCTCTAVHLPLPLPDGGWCATSADHAGRMGWFIHDAAGLRHSGHRFAAIGLDDPPDDGRPWLVPVREVPGGPWGYASGDGSMVIPCAFALARPFHGPTAAVLVGRHWGLIDRTGGWVVEPTFDRIDEPAEGLRPVRRRGYDGFIDAATSAECIPCTFAGVEPFSGGLALVHLRGRSPESSAAVLRPDGTIVADGLEHGRSAWKGLIAVLRRGRWGVLDAEGKERLPFRFADAMPPSDGVFPLKRGGFALYDLAAGEPRDLTGHRFANVHLGGFHDGLWSVADGGVFHVDRDGRQRTPTGCSDLCEDFAGARCVVFRYADNLHGYIDTTGALRVPRRYRRAGDFEPAGLAWVGLGPDGPGGAISPDGREYWTGGRA